MESRRSTFLAIPSVMAQAAYLPFDMDGPLFHSGFGLTYGR
jgi:hypothetical protein